jgi:putative transposase
MARWPRLVAPGFPMHVTHRGHNRQVTFHDDEDFARYREILLQASRQSACAIHAYAFMSNHVHLLITPAARRSAAGLMQRVGSRFVRYWNKRHRRSGTMWDGRFRSSIIDTDLYLLACSRYIDLNPVRAGISADAAGYAWSSFNRLALGLDDLLITPHDAYTALGPTAASRQAAYRAYCLDRSTNRTETTIRMATRGGAAAGDRCFVASLESLLRRPAARLPHGGNRRTPEWYRATESPIARFIRGR